MNNLTSKREAGNEQARASYDFYVQCLIKINNAQAVNQASANNARPHGIYDHPQVHYNNAQDERFSFIVKTTVDFKKVGKVLMHKHHKGRNKTRKLDKVSYAIRVPNDPPQRPAAGPAPGGGGLPMLPAHTVFIE
ncbi:MAG: hypothetical protein IBJ00_01775 [Alphaproteobacteria bacterium]|nr:hypothetical protein [Alphaproteobacteria bacterium]